MFPEQSQNDGYLRELRLLIEEVCCNLCRFQHVEEGRHAPGDIRINQEVALGLPGAYADICVQAPQVPPYFLEVKYGYPAGKILAHLGRKYGTSIPRFPNAAKVILVVDAHRHAHWPEVQRQIESRLHSGLTLEVWDEAHLLGLVHQRFGLKIDALSEGHMRHLREALDNAKGRYAFGEEWTDDSLQSSLLWRFGFWRLRQLREVHRLGLDHILAPGMYAGGVALLADLCSFSSYVRDTRDQAVIRQCLTSFYSKARYEILNTGGMIYQFIGDEVVGLYGIPIPTGDCLESALACALALRDLGNSISHGWQCHVDRLQTAQGLHIGIAMGDIQVVSLQPFGLANVGAVSDAINMASRLLAKAGPSEIVVSNTFLQGLEETSQAQFREIEPVDARNLGTIRAWKLAPAPQ